MLSAFLIASLVLAVTPGPAVLYILTRTVAHGRRAGLASLAGVALGNFGNALGASIGLAALFAISSMVFTFVKVAGALYLIYLGLRALRPTREHPGSGGPSETAPASLPRLPQSAPGSWPVFRDGFVVALLNPKTALFFAAFLPQFIDPASSPMLQSVLLGALFVVIAATTDMAYVLATSRFLPQLGGRLSPWFRRYGRYATASTFIGLGIYTALSGPRAAK